MNGANPIESGLTAEVESDALVLVTGVDPVYLNYQRRGQEALRHVTVDRLETRAAAGHFAEGSMLPKIRAAIKFLKNCNAANARAIITDWSHIAQALEGVTGTTITLER